MVALTNTASAAAVTATCTKTSDWGGGSEGTCTISNGTGSAVNGWKVEFDTAAGTSVSSSWDSVRTDSGAHHMFANASWNGPVAAGGTASFGFDLTGAGWISGCLVNGATCATGATPAPTTTSPTPTRTPTPTPTTTTPSGPGGSTLLGYFPEWGVYARNYHAKNIDTSGSGAKLTHINYAFGNVTGGQCAIGDSYADYDRFYSAAESVDGVADTWDAGALRGSFNQLRKLKQKYPNLKVLWSFGGWTWSGGFTQAAANPTAFANSCFNLVEDPRWADVFDGIDIDWEYPNSCGLACDTSGQAAFKNLMSALRSRFGSGNLVTAAITADSTNGGKIDAADYAGAAQSVNWYNVMTYDYFGAWAAGGPTAPHSPLTSYSGIPTAGFYADAAIQKLKSKGVPANKLLLGIGFYGRGWTGVTQSAPGGSASGPAPGTFEQGVEDYKVLKGSCPATGTVAGTAYAFCGGQWWSYDTPSTIAGKMSYARSQGLGGSFFWELTGDTANGELITAMKNGLG
jgi:chitinase